MTGRADLPGDRRTIVTVGTFDGVHRGHQAVLAEIVRRARGTGRASVLVTFEPHPLTVVAPERAPCLLTSPAEKRLLWPLFELDYVQVLPFTPKLRETSPETFVREILVERLRVGELVIGYDHGFGKNRAGDVGVLRRLGEIEGFAVDVVGPVTGSGGEAISSSVARRAVAAGDFDAVAEALGRPYSVLGRVEPGAGRGRGLGFPTANLRLDHPDKCLPPDGVYAVRMELDGEALPGAAHLGPVPTFDDPRRRLEVHLLDWDGGALYGARPAVEFVERLRPIERYPDAPALVRQMERDARAAHEALARAPRWSDPALRRIL
ncbi:MAG TPA: bifunctional riboflavin kinase/FAD synthetase [Gemmatimonadota bacterium]|nr:bifunctional riboflavin kinase/FAD synthetase [Gemmatimonadota bacterium]